MFHQNSSIKKFFGAFCQVRIEFLLSKLVQGRSIKTKEEVWKVHEKFSRKTWLGWCRKALQNVKVDLMCILMLISECCFANFDPHDVVLMQKTVCLGKFSSKQCFFEWIGSDRFVFGQEKKTEIYVVLLPKKKEPLSSEVFLP